MDLSLVPVEDLLDEIKKRSVSGFLSCVTDESSTWRARRWTMWGDPFTVIGLLTMAKRTATAQVESEKEDSDA